MQTNSPVLAAQTRSPLERVSTPMLLFTAMLAGLQVLSLLVLLPRFTLVPVAGSILPAASVREEEQRLIQELAEAKAHRYEVVLPSHDEAYETLKTQKRGAWSLLWIEEELKRAAAVSTPEKDTIVFTRIALDGAAGTVEVEGDVRGVGLRSMTVLASFVEEAEKLPMAEHLDTPAFTRVDDGKGSVHSPFVLHMKLKAPDTRD